MRKMEACHAGRMRAAVAAGRALVRPARPCYSNHMKRRIAGGIPKRAKSAGPMDDAMRFLGYRARTVREMERHLDGCQYGEVEVMEAVQRLVELNLLNDETFAADFVQTRLAAKPISRAHLREQLVAHELPREVVDAALLAVTDEMEQDNALAAAEKYLRQFAGLSEETRAERALKRILSRGFSFDTARVALEAAGSSGEAVEDT